MIMDLKTVKVLSIFIEPNELLVIFDNNWIFSGLSCSSFSESEKEFNNLI